MAPGAAVTQLFSVSRDRRAADCRWPSRSARFFRSVCHSGPGHAGAVAPPQHLVVTGLYRYVRNPMYVAVLSLIVGQGLLFGNVPVLEYGLVVWLGFHIFVLAYEEPTLRAKFGDEYKEFCANVRRWLPRLKPWRGTARTG